MGGFDLLPAHLERAAFEADPATYRNTTTFDTDPANPGLYFGPYKVVEAVTGSHLVLEPNATWYGAAPHFDRIVVRTIENTAALEANLLSGAIDMVAGEIGMNIDQGLAFAKRHGDDFNVMFKPGLTHEHMEANLDNPVLADLRVRRAILHGIDREAINQRLFDGRQPVSHHSVSPLDDVYTDDVRTYPYDPEKAAALLDAAGWTEIEGGVRHNASGERLTLSLMTTAGNRTREQVQQVIQSMLARVGIEVRIENEPARVLFGETVQKRTFEDLVMFAWISAPEAVPLTTLHSDMIPSEANGWSGQNIAGYANPEMDALIERIEKELDEEQRTRLWHELQRLYAEDLPALPLYWRAQTHILPTWLEGVRPTGHLGPSTMWVEEWRRAGG